MLNQLLCGLANQWELHWETQHEAEFTCVKESICDSLAFFDPSSRNIELRVDVSKFSLGTTILQNKRNISFASQLLNRTKLFQN